MSTAVYSESAVYSRFQAVIFFPIDIQIQLAPIGQHLEGVYSLWGVDTSWRKYTKKTKKQTNKQIKSMEATH